jgi:hypothetical protein
MTIDNIDLFYCAAQKLDAVGAEIWQMRLTDNRFEILAVAKSVSGLVRGDRPDGLHNWTRTGGDLQYAALRITNSETGGGASNVEASVMTEICSNFAVLGKTLRRVHLRSAAESDGLVDSTESQYHESKAVWLKIGKAIETVFNPEKFQAYIDAMNGATQQLLGDKVQQTTENVVKAFEISDDAKDQIIQKLFESHDYTRYGLAQAVTFTAHVLDRNGDAETASDMEVIGGEVMKMNDKEFAQYIA